MKVSYFTDSHINTSLMSDIINTFLLTIKALTFS